MLCLEGETLADYQTQYCCKYNHCRFHQKQRSAVLNIVYNLSSFGNYFGHLTELVVHKHQICNGFSRIGTAPDRNCAVAFAHSKNIVYAVSRHCNGVSLRFHSFYKQCLLLGSNASEHGILFSCRNNFVVIHTVQRYVLICIFYSYFACNNRNGQRIVSGNNFYRNVIFFKPLNNFGRVFADSIGKGDYSNRFKSVHGAVL